LVKLTKFLGEEARNLKRKATKFDSHSLL
jgi:hypothetical protein